MMTKKVFAEYLIYKFINSLMFDENGDPRDDVPPGISLDMDYKKLNGYVCQSTSLGIGLEYLGLLDDQYKTYIAERAGGRIIDAIDVCFNSKAYKESKSCEERDKLIYNHMLTARDILNLLPE